MFYVYLWLRPDRTPYYVGKGKGYRAYVKHGKVLPPPKERIIIVKNFDDEDESYKFEEWLIEVYGRKCEGGILNNTSVGGRNRNSQYRETEAEFKARKRQQQLKFKEANEEKIREYHREYYRNKTSNNETYRKRKREYDREYYRRVRAKKLKEARSAAA